MAIALAELDWITAEQTLSAAKVVVIPLGGSLKQHGPHLPLDTDQRLADALARRVAEQLDDRFVFVPTVQQSYYPAFTSYPGSVSLELTTATDLILAVAGQLLAYGPPRCYVLNTGLSTRHPLDRAQEILADQGFILRYTDITQIGEPLESEIAEQTNGGHADELETSMMLDIAPERVNLSRAVADCSDGPFERDQRPSGVFGNATLASAEKGRQIMNFWTERITEELKAFAAE